MLLVSLHLPEEACSSFPGRQLDGDSDDGDMMVISNLLVFLASGEHPSLDSEKLKLDPSLSERENLQPLSFNAEQISKHWLTKDL